MKETLLEIHNDLSCTAYRILQYYNRFILSIHQRRSLTLFIWSWPNYSFKSTDVSFRFNEFSSQNRLYIEESIRLILYAPKPVTNLMSNHRYTIFQCRLRLLLSVMMYFIDSYPSLDNFPYSCYCYFFIIPFLSQEMSLRRGIIRIRWYTYHKVILKNSSKSVFIWSLRSFCSSTKDMSISANRFHFLNWWNFYIPVVFLLRSLLPEVTDETKLFYLNFGD